MSKLRTIATGLSGFILLLTLVLAPTVVQAQSTQDFTIRSFDADYYLSRDSQRISKLSVTEKIVAEFPAYD